MHTGKQYHEFIQASQQDRDVRNRFLGMVFSLLPEKASVLDFGAGTGIDAKIYAASGHPVFVYEPSETMREHLVDHCRDEIANGSVVSMATPFDCRVDAVTANFAVLNHFADHVSLFKDMSRVVQPGGFMLASMLNPYYLGDARYRWWWANLANLARRGHYGVMSESRVSRFTPYVVARAAWPYFRLEQIVPSGLGMFTDLYMFLLLRRI